MNTPEHPLARASVGTAPSLQDSLYPAGRAGCSHRAGGWPKRTASRRDSPLGQGLREPQRGLWTELRGDGASLSSSTQHTDAAGWEQTQLDYQCCGCPCPGGGTTSLGPALLGSVRTSEDVEPQRLNFSSSEPAEPPGVKETSGTWGQPLVFTSIITIARILLGVASRDAFLVTPWKTPISSGNNRTRLYISCH